MQTKTIQSVLLTAALLALSGCLAQSSVQSKYMTAEADCRDEAQDKARESQKRAARNYEMAKESGTIVANDPQNDPAYVLGASFSDCMHKAGWKVTTPKDPVVVAGPVNPPVGAPGPGGTVLAKQPVTATTTNVITNPQGGTTITTTTTPVVDPQTVPLQPGAQPPGVIPGQPVGVTPAGTVKPAVAPTQATPASPILGPGVQPSPAPASTTPVQPLPNPAVPTAPGASTYQGGVYPEYGQGAGRNF